MNQTQINTTELVTVLKHMITNNNAIQKKGIMPVAVNVVGPAGIGKTSTIMAVGRGMGYKPENVVKLNLATLDEVGDLTGLPVEEYMMTTKNKEGKTVGLWVKEAAISSYLARGYETSNKTRMSYSVPEFIAGKTGPGVLILDDYTRASQRFTQAVMDLVNEQSFASWSLPQGWTIILSSNPDDGMYNVTDQDAAQVSRYMNLSLKFDVAPWAEWAEKHKIDSRCINFMLLHPELIKPENPEINARSVSNFFNSISTITDFISNLELIQNLGEGSLGPEPTAMFSAFINSKMDQLITVQEILDLNTPWANIESSILDLVKSGTDYRADIAHVITTRILNHAQYNIKDAEITPDLKKRFEEVIGSTVLGTDLRFIIGRRLVTTNKKFASLLLTDAVMKTVLE